MQDVLKLRAEDDVMFISAKTKVGYDEFRRAMYDRVKDLHIKRYPYNHFLY